MKALALGVLVGFVVVSGLWGGVYLFFLSKFKPWKKLLGALIVVLQFAGALVLLNRISFPREDSAAFSLGLVGTIILLIATPRIFLKDL